MSTKKQGVTWDLSGYFSQFNGPEMTAFKNRLSADIVQIQDKAAGLDVLSEKTADEWEKLILSGEDCAARLRHLSSYVGCLEAVNANDVEYLDKIKNTGGLCGFSGFEVDLRRAFTGVSGKFFKTFLKRQSLAPIAYFLRRVRVQAGFAMPPAEEKLAGDLGYFGQNSWISLYEKLSGRLVFEMVWPDGRKETMRIGRGGYLMSGADRKVGKAAFEGVSRAWASIEDVCAAALNAIAGTRLMLDKHRGVADFMDGPLFGAGISRQTLDAMYQAVHDNLGTAREILLSKARFLGRAGVCLYEREAPLEQKYNAPYTWEGVSNMVSAAFSVYPALSRYYNRFLKSRWLESSGRGGKRSGAFCTSTSVSNEERVFMLFNGTLRDVGTLAHEMGHAWHAHCLHGTRFWARKDPVTIAETAAIFAERILADGIISDKNISAGEKFAMLDADLGSAASFILDITARFEFEKSFYLERMSGEVSVARLKELMTGTQRRIYGDALEPGGEDPMLWASKRHYYGLYVPFYNFPYAFGYLFASALFARFKEEGAAFLPKYEAFLRLSGSDTVERLARRCFGFDLGDPAFWTASFTGLKASVAQYKKLLAAKALSAKR
ncbi:MAG: M3 family metallopeptidase [Elusimicrobiota bacterium]|nr:M3 family metallopeptidase [Elusimicrobiota bacterium]